MSRALDANELGHIFEILAKNELLTSGRYGHCAHAKFEQLFPPSSVVQDIDGAECDALLRKKLFRSKAAASARLSEQNKLFGDTFHIEPSRCSDSSCQRPINDPPLGCQHNHYGTLRMVDLSHKSVVLHRR